MIPRAIIDELLLALLITSQDSCLLCFVLDAGSLPHSGVCGLEKIPALICESLPGCADRTLTEPAINTMEPQLPSELLEFFKHEK